MSKTLEQLLLRSAESILKTNLAAQPGEKFLTITDFETYPIGRAFFEAGLKVGAESILTVMKERTRHGEEPPMPIAKAWESCDIFIAPTKYSLSHTQARKTANQAGARGATMPTITTAMFKTGAITADYSKVSSLCEKMGALMDKASKARVTSKAGTDIIMSIQGRLVMRDTGLLLRKGDFGNLPAGEVCAAPVEGSAEGTLVLDGTIASVGVVKKPVAVTVKEGFATNITGGQEAKKFNMLLSSVQKKEAYNVAELGVGCNPKARLIGNPLEDEKVYGTVHVALGDNSTFGGKVEAGIHLDGILRKPSLFLDGQQVIKDGKWII
jgi:leucyl aminopeptidase (aminopeptidase T)